MSLAGLSDDEIEKLEQKLLAKVPEDGSGIGNSTLANELQWDKDEKYYPIRDRLIDSGRIERWRGRGGSVRRVKGAAALEEEAPADEGVGAEPAVAEVDLYEPIGAVLQGEWAKDQRYEDFLVEITAKQGRRDTGGKWTRPDLVVVSSTAYLFVPGKHLDVTTFEVKTEDAMDVTAVYEALAHLRSATRSYVILHLPGDISDGSQAILDQVCDEAKRHGVGVIVVADPANYEDWEERVEPVRQTLNPERVNDFLSKQFSEGSKEAILKWWR